MLKDPDNLTTKDCRRRVFSPKSPAQAENFCDIDDFDVSATPALLIEDQFSTPVTWTGLSEIKMYPQKGARAWVSHQLCVPSDS